jgi:hypothetical protein
MKFGMNFMPPEATLVSYLCLISTMNNNMADLQTSEVEALAVPLNVGCWNYV